MPDRVAPPAGSRREAREAALLMLYEADVRAEDATAPLERLAVEPEVYTRRLVEGVRAERAEVDERIGSNLHDWTLDRLPVMDRSILRLATYELRSCPDVPQAAIINEAVELAGEYSTADSARFINGVLASIASLERD